MPPAPELGITSAQIATGAHVFQANCARCHDSDHNFSGGMDLPVMTGNSDSGELREKPQLPGI